MSEAAPGCSFSAHGEFIQSGDQKTVEQALNKLLFFEKADLVVGIVGNKVTAGSIPILKRHQTPVIINNLGAEAPGKGLSDDWLFYNSLHLWKSEWALGKWAQATYGGLPSVNMALFEAGYQMHDCFRTGAGSAGAESVTLNILRNMNGPVDAAPLINYLEEQRPPHAHALLCGGEGKEFLELFYANPSCRDIPLTAHPFVSPAGREPEGLITAATWMPFLDTDENRLFGERYGKAYETTPGVFGMLGYESGLAVGAAVQSIEGRLTAGRLKDALHRVSPPGPRGRVALSTMGLRAEQAVYRYAGGRTIDTLPAIHWDDPSFDPLQESMSGWLNPYLCI